ncbi:hypothetical protein C4D60_Mb03t04810 [Musa balbisiana]|uniref:Uncharacterized protein n=1 Tax=Musa balbisiana TaxID=52838 RepID=A0A4S8J7L9_MUSBA|nr:hypothetical protein C4D60_Mb03t04810 [Musa balbisiana]
MNAERRVCSLGVGNRTGASLSRPSSLFDRTGYEKGELDGAGNGIDLGSAAHFLLPPSVAGRMDLVVGVA